MDIPLTIFFFFFPNVGQYSIHNSINENSFLNHQYKVVKHATLSELHPKNKKVKDKERSASGWQRGCGTGTQRGLKKEI